MSYRGRLTIALLCGTAAGMLTPAFAGDSPWSSVRTIPGPAGLASTDSTTSVFNVTVSLYSDPQGDDKYPEDDSPDDADQQKYEEIFEYFADAMCEQTNGAHKLGKVSVFRKGRQSASSDIVWVENCHPSATPSGFGFPGSRINMCDIFTNGAGAGVDHDLLNDPKGAGYTIGHEWGHYGLGLFDEYRAGSDPADPVASAHFPRTTDDPVTPSIMNSQWKAKNGDFEWLNHSSAGNIGDLTKTAQGRIYGKSGWDALVQSTDDDPKATFALYGTSRTRYTNLEAVKPGNTPDEELPGAQDDCRSELDVIWIGENLETQLVIDRSGSMSGGPMDSAKLAAQTLVDVVPAGATALGVVDFDDAIAQTFPITNIGDPGTAEKNAAKAAIATLTARNTTALYAALQFGLNGLTSFASTNNTTAGQVVFVLSDGGDNASGGVTEADVIASYSAANVPIISFAYGSGAPGGTLQSMANATGGRFYSSPTTLAAIQQAFLDANAAVADVAVPASGTVTSAPSATESTRFTVDDTIRSFTVNVAYQGAAADALVQLVAPNGDRVSFTCTEGGGSTSCIATVEEGDSQVGEWSIRFRNDSGTAIEASHFVTANPGDGFTYTARMGSATGQTVTYPAPMIVAITVAKDWPISGLTVEGEIESPTGVITSLTFRDDGKDGDETADDGTYSAVFLYTENGVHTVRASASNPGGNGQMTEAGFFKSTTTDGKDPGKQNLPSVRDQFTRSTTLQVNATGAPFGGDDHGNTPGFFGCTNLTADNANVGGRIETGGDVDCFSVTGVDASEDLFVRVTNLSPGMRPEIKVFGADGTTEIADGNFDDNLITNGGVVVEVSSDDIDVNGMFVTVAHMTSSGTGAYNVSAGEEIASDSEPVGMTAGGGGGGGAFDLRFALGAVLLGLFGWMFRRRRVA